MTDIAAKRKPRGGNFANGVLNSYFLKENNKESEKMGTYMICGILIIVIVAALLGSRKHFKGEGGCCGGGGDGEDQAEALRHYRSDQKASY